MASLLVFLACLVGLVAVVGAWHAATTHGQHAGAGDGALTVAHLYARIERERFAEHYGRHALRGTG